MKDDLRRQSEKSNNQKSNPRSKNKVKYQPKKDDSNKGKSIQEHPEQQNTG